MRPTTPRAFLPVALALLLSLGTSAQAQDAAAAPMTLQQCIDLAMQRQPALAAARASLSAAQTGHQALQNLGFAALLAPDIHIRREQACLGVRIAEAGLQQAEWETRYAVTRNFYTIQYVQLQQGVIKDAIVKVEKGYDTAVRLIKLGDPNIKVTQIDADTMQVSLDLLRSKEAEVRVGHQRALSALREAIGVGPECNLVLVNEPLPALVEALDRDALISQGRALRGEMAQAASALRVSELEIAAQRKHPFSKKNATFASGADIHAKPIPVGTSNGEYKPGAIGPEMPVYLYGNRNDRAQRASDLNDRSMAVVDKTNNLVALEIDNYYQKWQEAYEKAQRYDRLRGSTKNISKQVEQRFEQGQATGEEYLRASTLVEQVQAQYNEALYLHALALAALERSTAGAYRMPVR